MLNHLNNSNNISAAVTTEQGKETVINSTEAGIIVVAPIVTIL